MSEGNVNESEPRETTSAEAGVAGERGRFWWLKSPWVIAFVAAALTLVLVRPFLRHEPDPPPVQYELPDFSLTSQSGEAFGSDDLRGEVWIASFFFTSCPSICPKLMQAVLSLQDRFEADGIDVKLVSITVDPEVDTSAVLREYGAKLGADFDRWTFLTGSEAQIRELVIDGFQLHLGDKERNQNNVIDIAHVGRLVLVDWDGGVRGLYETDDPGLDEVFHRAQHVLAARDD